MSLVFRPHRFKDQNGDTIEIPEMTVTDMYDIQGGGIQMEFAPETVMMSIDNFNEMQKEVERLWDWGRISSGKNISKCLRDSIKMLECVNEGHPNSPHQCDEKIERLKDELAKLDGEGAEQQK